MHHLISVIICFIFCHLTLLLLSISKTLPRSSAFLNRISVRFYETGCYIISGGSSYRRSKNFFGEEGGGVTCIGRLKRRNYIITFPFFFLNSQTLFPYKKTLFYILPSNPWKPLEYICIDKRYFRHCPAILRRMKICSDPWYIHLSMMVSHFIPSWRIFGCIKGLWSV